MSNFSGKGLAPVAHHAIATFGAYDMAGNVKEWTANAVGALRYSMGGAWNENMGAYGAIDASDPFTRTVSISLRTVTRQTPAPPATLAALNIGAPKPARTEKPVDDATYRLLAGLHRYKPAPLEARVKAAYANERRSDDPLERLGACRENGEIDFERRFRGSTLSGDRCGGACGALGMGVVRRENTDDRT